MYMYMYVIYVYLLRLLLKNNHTKKLSLPELTLESMYEHILMKEYVRLALCHMCEW